MMKEHPIPFTAPMVRAILDGTKTQTRRLRKPSCMPGDQLWVRENWRAPVAFDLMPPRDIPRHVPITLEASRLCAHHMDGKLRPGMFMCRWMSRIQLEVLRVWSEPLQDISEADARAEGAPEYEEGQDAPPPDAESEWSYCASYARLWDAINGPGSWASNPLVYGIEFRVVKP